MRVTFTNMRCRKCGKVWSPPPAPDEVEDTIEEHNKTCENADILKPVNLRKLAKPVFMHARGCQFPITATCTCGKEPNYSFAAREARGEIPAIGASEPHKVSEGGSEEAAAYWEKRNKLKPAGKDSDS